MMGVDVVRRSGTADPDAAAVPETDLASAVAGGHVGSLGDIGGAMTERVMGTS